MEAFVRRIVVSVVEAAIVGGALSGVLVLIRRVQIALGVTSSPQSPPTPGR